MAITPEKQTPRHIGRLPTVFIPDGSMRVFVVGVIVAILILGGAAFWIQDAVKESLEDILSESLRSVLRAEVSDLFAWLERETAFIAELAEDPSLLRETESLTKIAERDGFKTEDILNSPHQQYFRSLLGETLLQRDYFGFFVVEKGGLVLSASRPSLIGKQVTPTGIGHLAKIFQNKKSLIGPVSPRLMFEDETLEAMPPMMILGASITNRSGKDIAALGFLIDPRLEFSQIVGKSGLGKTGHTLAFDSRGYLLSVSRHEEELKELGLIPNNAGQTSILNMRLADPGGDLTRNYKPKKPFDELPLTEMAAAATAGRSGKNLTGYRDYRGVPVVGAWEFFPDYEFGMATELEVSEALRILRPLRIAGYALFSLLVLTMAVGLHRSFLVRRLKKKVDQVKYLGQYELLEKIGEGGMGTVYRAKHAMLRRPTAIKLLRREVATPEAVARFEREVQQTCQLTHPNTIEIYDYGRNDQGLFYYAMEYLSGFNLAELMEVEEQIPPERVVHILRQVLGSLEEAHSIGLIHRDIKLLNIFLCRRGGRNDVVKVLDFGLVKDIANQETAYLTSPGLIAGTPLYMAPERITSPLTVDLRSDLYSVGVVAFNLITGKDVFEATTNEEILHHTTNTPARPPSEVADQPIPEGLDQFVIACLAKNPKDRPKEAREAAKLLDAIHLTSEWTQEDADEWWRAHPPRPTSDEINETPISDITVTNRAPGEGPQGT